LSTGTIVGRDVGGAGLLALIILPSICGLRICVGGQRRGTTGAKAKAVAETLIVMFQETISIAQIHDATCHFAKDHAISRPGFDISFKATLLGNKSAPRTILQSIFLFIIWGFLNFLL
jgi:hypothetical protein